MRCPSAAAAPWRGTSDARAGATTSGLARDMASSAPWRRWTRRVPGSWEPKRWVEEEEEEEEEDFAEHMDANGVIGLEEGLMACSGRPRGSRFMEALDQPDLDAPAHVRRFSLREAEQEFGQEESDAEQEDARSPVTGDIEDPSDRTAAELAYWQSRQDATEEEEEEQGSSGDEERLEGTTEAESDGELYPELSYEGQCGSECSGSPEAPHDSPALRGSYENSRSFSTDGRETSDVSPGPSPPCRRAPGRCGLGRSLLLHLSADDLCDTPRPCSEASTEGGRELPAGALPLATSQLNAEKRRAGSGRARAGGKAALLQLGRQCRSLSPQRPRGRVATTALARPKAASTAVAESPRYGRGPLNHPLPDLSKVEARVKVAQSYRPPRGRALPAAGPGGPVLLKSPAEIVREALLSGGRDSPCRRPAPTAGRPDAFRCPREATELVQQLQDDYHKLLTKYAEAENTIDQLRLGAKVSLYADPPKPSHSVHMGTLGSGSKVMAFSIPQARTAAISTAPAPALQPSLDAEPAQGPVSQGTSPRPRSPPFPGMGCPTCPGECRCQVQHPCPGTQLTQTLAGQTHKFQAQVESFEAWVQTGKSTLQEQLQRFRKLKDTQDALERTYLQAREENRRLQQHPGTAGEFDPDRTVEGEIFCLGMRLEELKDRLERAAGSQRSPQSGSGAGSPGHLPVPLSATPVSSPAPSLQAPLPALGNPCPESPVLQRMLPCARPGTGGSSVSGESEAGGAQLPQPLWHKRLQVEEDFGDLLEQYQHFKSLPESLSLERLSLGGSQSPEEVDGLVAGERGLGKVSCRTQSPEERRDLPASPRQPSERRAGRLPPEEPAWENGCLPHAGEPLGTARAAAAPTGLPKPPGLQVPLSPRSSGAGSAVSRHQLRQAKPAQTQEQRIVSPETDSGFVGSEASRVSPLMHTLENQPPHTGTPGSLGRSGPISTAATLHPLQRRGAALLHSEKAPMGTYTACGHGAPQDGTRGPGLPPGTPSQTSSPPRWADSVTSEMAPMAPDADGTHTDSAVEERSSASSCSPPPGKTRAPAGLTHPALYPDQTHRDLLGSRMERDRAIRALRDEVSRLQQRLEESLHRSHSYPEGKGPPQRQTVARGLSPEEPAPSEEPNAAAPASRASRRRRSASLPRDGTELLLRSDRSQTKPRDGRPLRKSPQSPRDMVTIRGQHRAISSVGEAVRRPQQSTPKTTRCPTCRCPQDTPAPSSRAAHAEHSSASVSSPAAHIGPQAKMLEQPGLWYLAAGPPPAALGYLAPVPVVPFAPSVLYCSPAVSTSAPVLAGLPLHPAAGSRLVERTPRAVRQQAASRRLTLDLDDLEELNWSLSRAVDAAKSVKFTTKQMSRSLTSDLSKIRDLRGSCLF